MSLCLLQVGGLLARKTPKKGHTYSVDSGECMLGGAGLEENQGSLHRKDLVLMSVLSSCPPIPLSFQSPIVTHFFPSVLLWAFTVIMPLMVYFSAFLEAHWTR